MNLAATSKRRAPADPLANVLSRSQQNESETGRRDWTRPTLAAAVSIFAHALLLGVLGLLYVSGKNAEYAEVVPIEANLDVPMNLFDLDAGEIDTNPPLTNLIAETAEKAEAPAALETPRDDRQDFHGVNPGSRLLDPAANGAGAKVGDGVSGGRTGGDGDGLRTALPGGLSAVGRRFVFVIDRSASMNKPPPPHTPAMEWAKDELIRSIKSLPQNASFQVVFYSDTVMTLPNPDRRKDLIPATDFSKEKAIQFVRDLDAEGGTNHRLGLDRAFELKPDVVFFMTDADDDRDDDLRRLIDYVSRLNRRKSDQQTPASIHMIQIWHRNDSPTGVLSELAQRNNGAYKLIKASELDKRIAP
jgi:hypothetical protein